MAQNMFQEGLYHVFFKDISPNHPPTQITNHDEINNVRIHRWFGTVVNTRLLVTGVVQVLSALVCILTTVTHACVSYNCSVSMTTPVWSSLFYAAAGCLAMAVQRKANKPKVLGSFSNFLCNFFLIFIQLTTLHHFLIKIRSSPSCSIAFTIQCCLASVYILFLSWRGLRQYSPPHNQVYNRLSQDPDETNGPLLEQEEFSL
uniref:Si:dkey-30c15.13 n=1 Tax=Mastacembelus armatus TaxID=205130 RepID=A0A3Q3RX10_9TELE